MKQINSTLRLKDFLPYRLSVTSNKVSRWIATAYQDRFDLSIPEWRVIAVLAEEPGLTSKEVAERTAMDKVAVSRAVRSLVQSEHVYREASKFDGRLAHLQLSSSGTNIYSEVAPLASRMEEMLIDCLTPNEFSSLQSILLRLQDQMELIEGDTQTSFPEGVSATPVEHSS